MSPENYDRLLLSILYVGLAAVVAVLALGIAR